MADAAERLMTPDEFLHWCLTQEERYEFVDGRPVLKFPRDPETGMAGATRRHDQIVTNLIIALGTKLRGSDCRPTTGDIALRVDAGQRLRRPDVTLDCGKAPPDALAATRPVAVFEVLSPSTRQTDLLRKFREYMSVEPIRHIVFIEQHQRYVAVWLREGDGGWSERVLTDPADSLPLPAAGTDLTLADIYEDVVLDPA